MLSANILISLLPVVLFMWLLLSLDSYKLVNIKRVLFCAVIGSLAAVLSMVINSWLMTITTTVTFSSFSRYVAPIVEESLKGICLYIFLRSGRIGFSVDTAIIGFSLGAGFAVTENIYYLMSTESVGTVLWVVRGFGTAIMHGGTLIVSGIIAKYVMDRHPDQFWVAVCAGMTSAIVIHSFYNHFVLSPLVMTLIIVMVQPLFVFIAFAQSEKRTGLWLGSGLNSDLELLESIEKKQILETPIGQYLEKLNDHFPPLVVADLFCLLKVHAELSMQAKGALLARKCGLDVQPDPVLDEKLKELEFLEKSIGTTGRLAIKPLLRTSRRDLWQIHLLRD